VHRQYFLLRAWSCPQVSHRPYCGDLGYGVGAAAPEMLVPL